MKNNFSKKELRDFGFVVGLGLPIIIGWLLPSIYGHHFRVWTLWVGLPVLILEVTKPSLLFYPYKFWVKLGHVLGWINSRIILGLVFVFVLQPIAFLMRIFGYDPLRINKNGLTTYKEKRKNNKIDINRIF